MTQVGSEWPKWIQNGQSALDTYLIYLFEAPAIRNSYHICDNEAVYNNASTPESQFRKKYNNILYYMSREAVTSGAYRMSKEDTKTKLPYLFTKMLPRPGRELLLDSFTYWIGEPTVS